MAQGYGSYVPETLGDLLDYLSVLLLESPKFENLYYLRRDLDSTFAVFDESLRRLQPQLGRALYERFVRDSKQMRAYFAADPEQTTGDTRKGKDMVYELEDLLEARQRELAKFGAAK
jgi:hypothetical protein